MEVYEQKVAIVKQCEKELEELDSTTTNANDKKKKDIESKMEAAKDAIALFDKIGALAVQMPPSWK